MKPTRRLIYLELEKHGFRTVAELAEVVKIDGVNIRKELNRMHDDKMAYIKKYDKPNTGLRVAQWALGDQPHCPAPQPLSPGLAKASIRASQYANKAKALQAKAVQLRKEAERLEKRASEYIQENERIKVLTKGHVQRPRSVPKELPRVSPWAQLIP